MKYTQRYKLVDAYGICQYALWIFLLVASTSALSNYSSPCLMPNKSASSCSDKSVADLLTKNEKAYKEIIANKKFASFEKENLIAQHDIWAKNLFVVCVNSLPCAKQSIKSRNGMLAWALEVQVEHQAIVPESEDIAKVSKKWAVDILEESSNEVIGSGIIIAKNAVLTNCHVAETKKNRVRDSIGRVYVIDKVRGHGLVDLCVLTVQDMEHGSGIPIAPFAGFDKLSVIYSMGNPGGRARTFSKGTISRVEVRNARFSEAKRVGIVRLASLQHDAVSEPGSSGGALLDKYGRLIGVTTWGDGLGSRLGFAIPIQYLPYLPTSGVVDMTSFYETK